jgi:hypothetical protein
MNSTKPLIGMTEIIPNCTVSEFGPLLFDAAFLNSHISAKNVLVTGPYANSFHIRIEDDLIRDPFGLNIYPLMMETELIFEKTAEGAWDFYMLHNNLFYNLEGRLRIRQLADKMKIGLYLQDLVPKEPIAEEFKMDELIAIIRTKFRKFFDLLSKNANANIGFKNIPEDPKIKIND